MKEPMDVQAVIFDLDGVILDSESVWHQVRHDYVRAHGGRWTEDDQKAVMGANSLQWARHINQVCGVPLPPEEIYAGVVAGLRKAYDAHLPLYPGAVEAVRRLADAYPLAVASSSPREIIEYVLGLAGLRALFRALVSSDDVERGKPEPDVYHEACTRMGCTPERTVAVEDSANGIRAALAAGMVVVAIPNPVFPPPPDVVAAAHAVLGSVAELEPHALSVLEHPHAWR